MNVAVYAAAVAQNKPSIISTKPMKPYFLINTLLSKLGSTSLPPIPLSSPVTSLIIWVLSHLPRNSYAIYRQYDLCSVHHLDSHFSGQSLVNNCARLTVVNTPLSSAIRAPSIKGTYLFRITRTTAFVAPALTPYGSVPKNVTNVSRLWHMP